MLSLPPITLRLRSWKLIDRVALAFLLLCAIALGGWSPVQGGQSTNAAQRLINEDDIREAVLRLQMENWIRELDKDEAKAKDQSDKETAHGLNFKIFFLRIKEGDPTDEFMKRFGDIPRIVKKSSSAMIAKVVMMPVVDKETQERGIIFSVDEIRWLGKDHVKVEGGYHCDGLCGAGYTFDVRLEKGKWVVKKQRMNWVS